MVMGDDIGMETEDIIETLRKKFERVSGVLNERGRRRCGRQPKRTPWGMGGKVWWRAQRDWPEPRSTGKASGRRWISNLRGIAFGGWAVAAKN